MIKFFRLFFLGFFVILFCNFVVSIGISPARTSIDFSPGLEKNYNFKVVNSEGKDMNVVFRVDGNLSEYIEFEKEYADFLSRDSEKEFNFKVKLPSEMKPGVHMAEIIATEVPLDYKESGQFIGSSVGVATQIYVYVPYPGKYLEINTEVTESEQGELLFIAAALNRGKEDIKNARLEVGVFDKEGKKVLDLKSEGVEIPKDSRKEFVLTPDEDILPGEYLAEFIVYYDSGKVKSENEFSVGEKKLFIKKIEVNDFKLGEIAKFDALIESRWNGLVKNAYLELIIYENNGERDNRDVLADIKSQDYDVPALSEINMIAYWDTLGVNPGTYDGELILKYAGGKSTKKIKLKVTQDEILAMGLGGENVIGKRGVNLEMILIIIVVVLVIMNIMWFLVLRKHIKKKKKY